MAESRYDLHGLEARGIDRWTSMTRRQASPALARTILSFRRPTPQELAAVARSNAQEPYTYLQVGASASRAPRGWLSTSGSVVVGSGPAAFTRASAALRSWEILSLPWIVRMPAESPPRPGQVLAFATRHFGIWTVHTCRVAFILEPEQDVVVRDGFAWGTVPTHPLQGEQRFLVEWDRGTDEVRFEIRAFSRPAHPLLRRIAPVAAGLQRRFVREALAVVQRAV